MKSLRYLIIAALVAFGAVSPRADTTLLPPGVQCWATANGPLIAGTVNTYIPSTATPKTTWTNSSQSATNTNPITLDANGCAIIFGVGSYRLLIKDSAGVTVYDVVTTDVSASNSVFWAGLSGGTPNVITVVDPGFNNTPGTIITFRALNSNTGATTLTANGSTTQIVKDTSAGPVALTGGEIIAGNAVSVLLDTIGAAWHLQSTVIATTSGSSAPLCGATGLVVKNNAGTPNTSIDVTWGAAVTVSTTGQVFNSSTPTTVTINATASGAINQWDATRPTSNWGYIWLAGNGSTMGAIGSSSATAPTLPSGYTFKCRVGAVQFDGAQNLYRSYQAGRDFQYVIGVGNTANTGAAPFLIATGTVGTFSTTSPTLAATTVAGAAACAAPTATAVLVNATSAWKATTGGNIEVAANTGWGGANNGPEGSNGNVYPLFINGSVLTVAQSQAWIVLEAATIAIASSGAGAALTCQGFRDAVNAS